MVKDTIRPDRSLSEILQIRGSESGRLDALLSALCPAKLLLISPLIAGTDYIIIFHFFISTIKQFFEHIKDKTWHQSTRFQNSWPPFCQIWIIFTNFKWVMIRIKYRGGQKVRGGSAVCTTDRIMIPGIWEAVGRKKTHQSLSNACNNGQRGVPAAL